MDYKTALNKSAALCSRQEYCCADMRRKHERWGVEQADSEKIMEVLIKDKFIDETRYTRFFVRDKFRFNRWGKQKILWQLKLKKVPRPIIDEALAQISSKEYLETLEELITEKLRQVKQKEPIKRKAAIVNNAATKGFEYEAIMPIVERLLKTES